MTALIERIRHPSIVVAPGIYDALSALIAAQAGFEVAYLSGASIAYTHLGRPDIGLVSFSEVAATLAAIRERVELALIVDADTGFGNAINVGRTVRVFERNGATGIQLEDQTLPKRCGHLAGKTLISESEMSGKIKAAVDARHSEDTLIIARTDAIAVTGFDNALERAEAYLAAGADVLFVEAPQSDQQASAITTQFAGRAPLLANMVEGGKTPLRDAPTLEKMGYSVVIFPGGLVRATAALMTDYFNSLQRSGSTAPFRDRMLNFSELNTLIGTDELLARGLRYAEDRDHEPR